MTASRLCRRVFRCRAIARISLRPWTPWMKGTSRPWGFRFCVAADFWQSDTRGSAACGRRERAVRETLLAGRGCRGQTHPARSQRRRCRSRLSAWPRPSSIKTPLKNRWISCICRWPQHPVARMVLDVAVERRSTAIGRAGEGSGSDARCEPADVAIRGLTRSITGTRLWKGRESP